MLINFSREALRTTVTCDTVSTEDYEVGNLLRDTGRGFLAYSCIRPPVNIDFAFNCLVRISHVVVWPTVGAQRSSGFRVFSRAGGGEEFRLISSCFLGSGDAGVVFCGRDGDRGSVTRPSFASAVVHGPRSATDRVKHLRISVVKTEKSVPAVQRVEIWGYVSRHNSGEVREQMSQLLRSLDESSASLRRELTPEADSAEDRASTTKKDQGPTTPSAPEVPECFLDPITCSIMQQPVVLPSGKVIDQSTLERYAESQALWGRTLTDPFTGVPFTESHRPVFAAKLKAMIDKFLSDNCNLPEVRSMPRLLGAGRGQCESSRLEVKGLTGGSDTGTVNKLPTASHSRSTKLPIVSRCDSLRLRTPVVAEYSRSFKSSSRTDAADGQSVAERVGGKSGARIDDNLENNLKLVMSGLKRFDEKTERAENSGGKNVCLCCETYTYYYRFPCSHLVCRKVLMANGNLKCSDCGICYKSSQIERINI